MSEKHTGGGHGQDPMHNLWMTMTGASIPDLWRLFA